jgi:hypothetical protein
MTHPVPSSPSATIPALARQGLEVERTDWVTVDDGPVQEIPHRGLVVGPGFVLHRACAVVLLAAAAAADADPEQEQRAPGLALPAYRAGAMS